MKSKLLLTLWLLGGVLYAGSTVFLAHAVLGGIGVNRAGSKPTALAAANGAQCQKEDTASTGATEPTKTAAAEPPKPASAPESPAPDVHATNATPPSASNEATTKTPSAPASDHADQQQASAPDSDDADQDSAPLNEQQANAAPDQAGPEDPQAGPGPDDQAGPGPDQRGSAPTPPERDEWAQVVAGTADMRSEPSLQSQLIYALPSGWQVRVIARKPGWVQVQDSNSGAAGWVESSAIAPIPSQRGAPGNGGYGPGPGSPGPGYGQAYPPPDQYADGYPPDPRWRRYQRRGDFGDFLRGVFGGF